MSATPDVRTFAYKRIGALEIPADVYVPTGPGPRPAVVWFHGGGLIFGTRKVLARRWLDTLERYLSLGFAVVAPDYRLAPETKADGIVEDACDACEWVREKGPGLFGIDPGRIALVGNSAGAFLSLNAAARCRPRPAAVVSFYGFEDLAAPWAAEPSPRHAREPAVPEGEAKALVGRSPVTEAPPDGPRPRYYLYCRQRGIWASETVGRDPRLDPAWFDRFRPVRDAFSDFPPTLFLHGKADEDVPFGESVRMAGVLAAKGVPHGLVLVDGVGHVFDGQPGGSPGVRAAKDRAAAFLAAHLGRQGKPKPDASPA